VEGSSRSCPPEGARAAPPPRDRRELLVAMPPEGGGPPQEGERSGDRRPARARIRRRRRPGTGDGRGAALGQGRSLCVRHRSGRGPGNRRPRLEKEERGAGASTGAWPPRTGLRGGARDQRRTGCGSRRQEGEEVEVLGLCGAGWSEGERGGSYPVGEERANEREV